MVLVPRFFIRQQVGRATMRDAGGLKGCGAIVCSTASARLPTHVENDTNILVLDLFGRPANTAEPAHTLLASVAHIQLAQWLPWSVSRQCTRRRTGKSFTSLTRRSLSGRS
jgi:hypothetical protein